jgi:sugar lactone lactonase YvrE
MWSSSVPLVLIASLAAAAPSHGTRAERPEASAARRSTIKYIGSGALRLPESLAARELRGSIATDADGNVYASYLSSESREDVAVFDSKGNYRRSWRLGRFGNTPSRFAIGPDGLFYATGDPDNTGGNIEVFTLDGQLVRQFGQGYDGFLVNDIELDPAGNVYVTQRPNRPGEPDDWEIARFDRDGKVTARFAPVRTGSALLYGLAVALDGSLWVIAADAALTNERLLHLDANGSVVPRGPKVEVLFQGRGQGRVGGTLDDVDFANGRLYIAGEFAYGTGDETWSLAVLTPVGELVDVALGGGDQVAVHGEQVYVTSTDVLRPPPGVSPPSARSSASARADTCAKCAIGELQGKQVLRPDGEEAVGDAGVRDCKGGDAASRPDGRYFFVALARPLSDACTVTVMNTAPDSACPKGTHASPGDIFLGGKKKLGAKVRGVHRSEYIAAASESVGRDPLASIWWWAIAGPALTSGAVVVSWECHKPKSLRSVGEVYEYKGDIELYDPSGNVVDAKTGLGIDGASVRLQFSPAAGARFGSPGARDIKPQLNPQRTAKTGAFGWDVAPGFWRLRVTAFGYRPFTSQAYKVPPEVAGLKLKLRRHRRHLFLVDPYRGQVGDVTLGRRLAGGRVGGLRLRVVGGRVRSIQIANRRFRTGRGVSVGTNGLRLLHAYPLPALKLVRRDKKLRISYLRVARATFALRRGYVVGITLGR